MADPSFLATAFSLLGNAIEVSRWLREADNALNTSEAKMKVAELMSALADIKMHLIEARELLHVKDREIKRLREALETKETLVRFDGKYFKTDESGEPHGEPLCSRCWEVDSKQIHLVRAMGMYMCPQCKMLHG